MAFKPKNATATSSSSNFEQRNYPTPKSGPRKARISLIVDLGEQNREDFEDPITKELKPQKPCQQVAVFADLVNDTVDYGGSIGKAHYRLLLNKSFQGNVQGVNFTATPPKDAKGNLIAGKKWGFHPANLLTKLAKAVGKEEVIESMDVEQLLDMPFSALVEVKETPAKDDKKDKDGNPIIYKNVNFKGASPVPPAEDPETGEEIPAVVAELKIPAKCITFDNATVDDIQFIRGNLIKMIKLANNYAGSAMQRAIEAFEAKSGNSAPQEQSEDEDETPAAKPAVKKAAVKKAPVAVPTDDMDDDVPF